jgi:hypothetical protein
VLADGSEPSIIPPTRQLSLSTVAWTSWPKTRGSGPSSKITYAQSALEQHNGIVTEDQPEEFKPGDIYEDCAFHPVLCTVIDGDDIQGISLIDATAPRACTIGHCGVIKLSIADVIAARADWPAYRARREAEVDAEVEAQSRPLLP